MVIAARARIVTMSRIPLLTLFASVVALGTGCYTEGDGYGYAQPVYAQPGGPGYADGAPAVGYVSVAPGVEVVSDYDYPVFFTGGLYWRSFGGVWYSSGMYNGGWAINYNVPIGVRGIARPSVVGYVDIGYGTEGVAVFTGINYPF